MPEGVGSAAEPVDGVPAEAVDYGVDDAGGWRNLEHLLEQERDGDRREHDREEDEGSNDARGALEHKDVEQRHQVPHKNLAHGHDHRVLDGEEHRVPHLWVARRTHEVVDAHEGEARDGVALEDGVAERPDDRNEHHQGVDEKGGAEQDNDRPLVAEYVFHVMSLPCASAVWVRAAVVSPPPASNQLSRSA
jgi:hypothetical protein